MTDDPWRGPRRLDTPEQMDAPDVDPARLGAALSFIRRINRRLGYTRATVRAFDALPWPAGRPLRVLDVATGSADVPAALIAWAGRTNRPIDVVGLDLHAETLAFARDFAGPALPLVRGDALALPFADGAFDAATSSMFLHHLPDDLAAAALAEMARVANGRVVVADLVRDRRAYRWISLFTLFSDPMVRHDARVSVRQAFTPAEAAALAGRVGLTRVRVRRAFGHRFILTAGH